MVEQGRFWCFGAEQLSIVDRLRGLEKFISPESINQSLAACGKQSRYRCLLNAQLMMWVVVAMGLFTEMPIRQVFRHVRRLGSRRSTPSRSSLCMARQRLGSAPLRELYGRLVRPLANPQTPGAFYRGLRKVAIDGTVLEVPDRAALQHFGRSSGPRGEGPFPQIRKVSLVEIGTHIELAFAYGGWRCCERKLAESLWDQIPPNALLIMDRGFYSYSLWKKLHRKHSLLARVQKSMVLKPIKRFQDGSFLAKVYPSHWYRANDKQGIVVRVIQYTLDDPERTGHQEVHTLLTNLLDAEEYPALELIGEYHERWEVELVFDEQKTHQDPCRAEKTTNLRSETVEGITQELYAQSIGHFVIRAMMLEAAEEVKMDVDRLSFKGCFQVLKCRLPECDSRSPLGLESWYRGLLRELREERLPPRANRVNYRVIKRKMSRWPRAHAQHRSRPPLKKTFMQTVVIKT